MADPLFKNIEHLKIIQLTHELIEARHEISLQNEVKILLLAEIAKLTAELEQARLTEAIKTPDKQDETALKKLTRREREVIVMLGHGASNKDIAQSLDLVEATVKIHVQGILRKLNLSNRVQAALLAVRSGLGASSH
ncbi:MAG: LuxR C-terminal-related transcriptional regulator [Methylotenera sp.]|nr:LuxR C-terminal-related transcriptional regulator [Methylotenera sp.]